MKPKQSIINNITTDSNGLCKNNQSGMVHNAVMKKHQSVLVMLTSDLYLYARKAISKVKMAETPVAQAPAPPPSDIWAKNMIEVIMPQIIHENKCGLVLPAMIDFI